MLYERCQSKKFTIVRVNLKLKHKLNMKHTKTTLLFIDIHSRNFQETDLIYTYVYLLLVNLDGRKLGLKLPIITK